MWVQSLGLEDPLEKEMATHSSILAWKIPWTEEPGSLQSIGSQGWPQLSNLAHTASLVMLVVKNLPADARYIRDVDLIPGSGRSPGKGNGNTLQYSYLENPMNRGSWWAIVMRSQSWT